MPGGLISVFLAADMTELFLDKAPVDDRNSSCRNGCIGQAFVGRCLGDVLYAL